MADTIITNSPEKNGGDNSSAGWVVALVLIFAVFVAGFLLYQNGFFTQAPQAPSDTTNINVTIPNPIVPDAGAPPGGNP